MRPFIVLIFMLLPLSVTALQIGDFFQTAEVIKANAVASANASIIKVQATIKGYAANQPYQIKTVDVPKASFLSHLKTNLKGAVKKNAWYAAWFATMAAAGWAIDELQNQVTVTTNVYKGFCNNVPPAVTAEQCAKSIPPNFSNMKYSSHYATTPLPNTGAATTFYKVRFVPINGTTGWMEKDFSMKWSGLQADTQNVTDDALYDSFVTKMLQDPVAAAQAFMVPDPYPYPYPHIFPDPIEYIPGVSQSDQELLDALIKGQLQTTNPSAANYVTPEKYAELQATLTRLQQGLSPEAIVGELNDKLKEPITQAQLEETLKKEKEAEAKADQEAATKAQEALAPSESALDKLSQDNTWLEQQITDAANASPPTMGLGLPQWVWPSGRCQPFPFTFTVGDLSAKADDKGTFCTFYNDVAHPLIYWFINLLVALYIFVLWNKTMLQVIGAR